MQYIINIIKRVFGFETETKRMETPVRIHMKGEALPYDESTIEDVTYEEI